MKCAILLILCLFTGSLPASGETNHNSEYLVPINAAINVRQVDRSPDNADAILLAQALSLQQPALASPDAFDAAPVVQSMDIAPKPPSVLGVNGSASLPADVFSDPSKTSPVDIAGATSVTAQTFDIERKSAGESPFAAILGLIAGVLMMVGIGGRARRMSSTRRLDPDGMLTDYHPAAAIAPRDRRMAGFVAPSAMIHVVGEISAASEQRGFARPLDRQTQSGSSGWGQGSFGQADFRDIAYGGDGFSSGPFGDHVPVVVVYPGALGQWHQRPAETAAPIPVERMPFNILAVEYRIFTFDGGTLRSCQQFSAADDHAALALARFCEPKKAFELWRASQLVTRQPPIQ